MTKRQIIFASAKGGVGKSYACRTFIDLARQANRTVSAWDLDGGTGSLAILYPDRDAEKGVATEDIRDPQAPGAWLDALFGKADDVVMDVPGGALPDLLRVLSGGSHALAEEARAAGRELVIVSVIGIKRDATGAPQDAITLFGSQVHHVVLKNGYFGAPEDFVIFDGIVIPGDTPEKKYGKTSDAVRNAGGEVVYLPKLNSITDALLDVEGLSFAAGTQALSKLGRRHASNTRAWLALAESSLVKSWLCPRGNVPAKKPMQNGKATLAA